MNALRHLTKNKEIHITSSDNGDRIVNMDRRINNDKINLLQDPILITCEKIEEHEIITQPQQFNKANLINNEKKSWYKLIEYYSGISKNYGLHKTHNTSILLRHIK